MLIRRPSWYVGYEAHSSIPDGLFFRRYFDQRCLLDVIHADRRSGNGAIPAPFAATNNATMNDTLKGAFLYVSRTKSRRDIAAFVLIAFESYARPDGSLCWIC
jgi:hypothetical protein